MRHRGSAFAGGGLLAERCARVILDKPMSAQEREVGVREAGSGAQRRGLAVELARRAEVGEPRRTGAEVDAAEGQLTSLRGGKKIRHTHAFADYLGRSRRAGKIEVSTDGGEKERSESNNPAE